MSVPEWNIPCREVVQQTTYNTVMLLGRIQSERLYLNKGWALRRAAETEGVSHAV